MPLRHPADAGADDRVGRLPGDRVPAQADRSRAGRRQAQNALQRRRLADAVAAKQSDHLAVAMPKETPCRIWLSP